jgi:hypothetical protein
MQNAETVLNVLRDATAQSLESLVLGN